MNRRATLAMTAVSLAFVGVALLAGGGIGYTQQRSDSDNVNAAINAFHAALFLMREWDTWTVDGWRQSRSALQTDQAMRL